jgi:hypothetical protein
MRQFLHFAKRIKHRPRVTAWGLGVGVLGIVAALVVNGSQEQREHEAKNEKCFELELYRGAHQAEVNRTLEHECYGIKAPQGELLADEAQAEHCASVEDEFAETQAQWWHECSGARPESARDGENGRCSELRHKRIATQALLQQECLFLPERK